MSRTLTLALLSASLLNAFTVLAQPVNDLCSSVTPELLSVGGSVVFTAAVRAVAQNGFSRRVSR